MPEFYTRDAALRTGYPIEFTMIDFIGIGWTNTLVACGGQDAREPTGRISIACTAYWVRSISNPELLMTFGGRVAQFVSNRALGVAALNLDAQIAKSSSALQSVPHCRRSIGQM